jgi:ADP-L-glycero-D-manno-heptose 6-epimerase
MIVITGARGFIGSNLVHKFNQVGLTDLLLVDELENQDKEANLKGAEYRGIIHRNDFLNWFEINASEVNFVYHLGARTDTTEINKVIFDKLNLNYSKAIFNVCVKHKIPLVYASSAATYGDGSFGYSDQQPIHNLQPLNEYGWSKQNFDLWVEQQTILPPFFAGLKFFNVYGPGENHKGRMASVIYHAYHQILKTGEMKLFQSHHPEYKDGEQMRDFIFVNDLTEVCRFLYENSNKVESGIYNLGTGKARSFNDLVKAVFKALNLPENISYIPTPEDIRDKYQYFTEANMQKLLQAGYKQSFTSLEEGVSEYVKYLKQLD